MKGFNKDSELPHTKQLLSSTVTRQLTSIEKLTIALAQRVEDFYENEVDKQYISSANLDSKILLHSKRDPNSASIRELSLEKEKLDLLIKPHQLLSRNILDSLVNLLINKKNPRRHFEIILGTILLNYPIDKRDSKFSKRTQISETLRPMYQSALMSLLLEKLAKAKHQFKSEYINELLQSFNTDDAQAQLDALTTLQKIFVEIIYLKEMGLHSPQSLEILSRAGENNLLEKENRKALLIQSKKSSKEFHHYGIGVLEEERELIPMELVSPRDEQGNKLSDQEIRVLSEKLTDKQMQEQKKSDRVSMMQQAARFTFIKDVMDPEVTTSKEIDQLLKVCQIYSSFILSVKNNVDKELHIKAFDMMHEQAKLNKIHPQFTQTLLAMMGRFPIGSGVYFIDLRRHANELGTVDKAVVVGLNPLNPDEPIVKRVTTNYKYKVDSRTGNVDAKMNLYFEQARSGEHFTEKLQTRFMTQYKTEDNDLLYSFRANDAFRTLSISEAKLW